MRHLLPLLLVPALAVAENQVLLIGIGQYQTEKLMSGGREILTALSGIDLDVRMMRESAGLLGFRPNQIKVLENREATLAAIRAEFRRIASSAGKDDRVLIYFSGHGSQIPDTNGDERSDGLDEVLLPWDFAQGEKTLVNVLTDDEIAALVKAIPSEHVVLIFDSCNSGTADKGIKARSMGAKGIGDGLQWKAVPSLFPPAEYTPAEGSKAAGTVASASDNYVALMAAQEDEFASATSRGSVFTLAVHTAIKEAAVKYSPLTAERLVEIAAAAADKFCREMRDAGKPASQHPQLRGNPAKKGINLRIIEDYFTMVSQWADSMSEKITLTANAATFKPGKVIELKLSDLPVSGYLNLIQVSDKTNRIEVLFPNQIHSGGNRVEKGATITLPSPSNEFDLEAHLADGATHEKIALVALIYEEPVDLHKSGEDLHGAFRGLARREERAFEIVPRKRGGAPAYAGKVVVEVTQ